MRIVRDTNLGDLAAEVVELTARRHTITGYRSPSSRNRKRVTNLSTDPFQLRQVLLNLVTNAIQAVPKGGRVSLRLLRG